jgi:hypothetical protein
MMNEVKVMMMVRWWCAAANLECAVLDERGEGVDVLGHDLLLEPREQRLDAHSNR